VAFWLNLIAERISHGVKPDLRWQGLIVSGQNAFRSKHKVGRFSRRRLMPDRFAVQFQCHAVGVGKIQRKALNRFPFNQVTGGQLIVLGYGVINGNRQRAVFKTFILATKPFVGCCGSGGGVSLSSGGCGGAGSTAGA